MEQQCNKEDDDDDGELSREVENIADQDESVMVAKEGKPGQLLYHSILVWPEEG